MIVSMRPFAFAFRSVDCWIKQAVGNGQYLGEDRLDDEKLVYFCWCTVVDIEIGGDDDSVFRPDLSLLPLCVEFFRQGRNCLLLAVSNEVLYRFAETFVKDCCKEATMH